MLKEKELRKDKNFKNKIYLINGPNLNMLGIRDQKIYGKNTLLDLEKYVSDYANKNNFECVCFQSNHEGDIIDLIQKSRKDSFGIIINAGAYTHYSYAIRDAIECSCRYCIEVHISNILEREDFRKTSVISSVCSKTIMGKGFDSYIEAVDYLIKKREEEND